MWQDYNKIKEFCIKLVIFGLRTFDKCKLDKTSITSGIQFEIVRRYGVTSDKRIALYEEYRYSKPAPLLSVDIPLYPTRDYWTTKCLHHARGRLGFRHCIMSKSPRIWNDSFPIISCKTCNARSESIRFINSPHQVVLQLITPISGIQRNITTDNWYTMPVCEWKSYQCAYWLLYIL